MDIDIQTVICIDYFFISCLRAVSLFHDMWYSVSKNVQGQNVESMIVVESGFWVKTSRCKKRIEIQYGSRSLLFHLLRDITISLRFASTIKLNLWM